MIASLRGTVEYLTDNGVVLDVGGVGYAVQTGAETMQILSAKGREESVHLYTYLSVGREGDLSLFGFLSKDELQLFRLLITVSGIGPKGALSLLSAMSAEDLTFAILSGDAKTIAKAPGVGKKTAERLVLDLRDKLSKHSADALEASLGTGTQEAGSMAGVMDAGGNAFAGKEGGAADAAAADAAEALTALGYARLEAVKAVKAARAEREAATGEGADDIQELLRGALRHLA